VTDKIEAILQVRANVKDVAAEVWGLRGEVAEAEAIANVMLAYRHLEDASMRLGKVLQALDGGVSVYDKRGVVGAP
jgi:hypothetical protein